MKISIILCTLVSTILFQINGGSAAPKIFIHVMPWFETKATNDGHWGQHWAMNGANPDQIVGDRRKICSKYYPLIDLYASGDSHVIDWQLGLMKLSGVSGILVDWYGASNVQNYRTHRINTEALIKGCEKIGLEFGIVYEDQSLPHVKEQFKTDVIAQAQEDMIYIRDHYFTNKNYMHVNGAPVLLNFGPEFLKSRDEWNKVLSVFKEKLAFIPEANHLNLGESGQFAWIWKNHLTDLTGFYHRKDLKIIFGCAYPGFDTYPVGHQQTWKIPVSVDTFEKTLDLAFSSGLSYIQIATWNDYGEGTMIEPTREFKYAFLTALQQKTGVKHTLADLEQVTKVFHQRKYYSSNMTKMAELEKELYSLVSVK